jgi:6-phosphogluconolactonase
VSLPVEWLPDAEAVATRAAGLVADAAREAVGARGRFVFAVSGGRTPWRMLELLARAPLPWASIDIVQVDERVAPAGAAERNLTRLEAALAGVPARVHAMPVADADATAACAAYAAALARLAGTPPVIDLVHLGLGADGHTASLVPDDPVLDVADADVAMSGPYQGCRRMTLTFPALARARRVLWVVTGGDKADALARLLAGDPAIPAARVARTAARVLAERAVGDGPG